MAKKKKKISTWEEAKARYKLSEKHIQMAKKLGMKPTSLSKLGGSNQEKWKIPLRRYIEEFYQDQFDL